jgi:hypothetical protein
LALQAVKLFLESLPLIPIESCLEGDEYAIKYETHLILNS